MSIPTKYVPSAVIVVFGPAGLGGVYVTVSLVVTTDRNVDVTVAVRAVWVGEPHPADSTRSTPKTANINFLPSTIDTLTSDVDR